LKIMPPRKAPRTRTTPATTTTTTSITNAQLQAMIDQGVTAALAARDAKRNGDDSHTSRTGVKSNERVARGCTYQDFMKCQPLYFKGTKGVVQLTQWTVGHDVAYVMTYTDLEKKMTDKYCLRNEMKKLEAELMFLKESDKIESTFAERQAENKRKLDSNNQAQQQLPKRQNVAQAYATGTGERKEYVGTLPLCNKCKFHHNGPCTVKCANCKRVSHLTRDCWSSTATNNQRTLTCYECGNQGHYKSDCPELKNGNQAGGAGKRRMVLALVGGETNQDLDDMEDNTYA
ncbi:hypothetical protein Tco_1382959, partial [Tanacetum coccineum]